MACIRRRHVECIVGASIIPTEGDYTMARIKVPRFGFNPWLFGLPEMKRAIGRGLNTSEKRGSQQQTSNTIFYLLQDDAGWLCTRYTQIVSYESYVYQQIHVSAS